MNSFFGQLWSSVLKQSKTESLNTHQRIFPLPNTQYLDFTATNHMEEDDEYCSNPTQSTDDNEEAIMRENAGFFMTQNQCKCNHTKNLEILQHNHP